jgi:very-short-patch-repair endonuclease
MTDAERRQRGCRVIRFWNEEVFLCPDRVVEIIYDALLASAHSRAA